MSSISSLCLVLLVCFCLHQIPAANADFISETCAQTRFPSLCDETLRKYPESKSADIRGLARIELNATAANATSIKRRIAELQKSTTDKSILKALQDCAENYDDARSLLAESLNAFDQNHYADVNQWVSAAMTDSDSCEEGFKTGTSKLTEDNQKFFQLCSNVLALTNKLKRA